MRVKHILEEKGNNVFTINAGRTIHDAISSLNQHRIGALIVTGDDDEVVGIITERDILRRCGDTCGGKNITDVSGSACASLVEDAMTAELVIGVPDDDPDYIMGVMTKNRIRHLPILEDGNLAGIISIGDLVNAHLEERVFESRTLKEYITRNESSTKKDDPEVLDFI